MEQFIERFRHNAQYAWQNIVWPILRFCGIWVWRFVRFAAAEFWTLIERAWQTPVGKAALCLTFVYLVWCVNREEGEMLMLLWLIVIGLYSVLRRP